MKREASKSEALTQDLISFPFFLERYDCRRESEMITVAFIGWISRIEASDSWSGTTLNTVEDF